MDVKKLIEKVVTLGGNELHLKIGSQPLIRKNNNLTAMDMPALIEADMTSLIEDLLTSDEAAKFSKTGVFEANHFGQPPCNFRLSLFHSQQKPVAYIKLIKSEIPTVEEIGFPTSVSNLLSSPKGLMILTGPSRSGISTSMAALVEHMNAKYKRHILVIEDPIQYYYEPKECIISQRQFSKDIFMVEQGINFAKRMDVDALVIGDLKRDIPFKNVMEYVAGGNLVVLCMQTLGAVAALEKIVYSFPENYRDFVNQVLTENLLAVCSQTLITNSSGVNVPIHEVFIPNKNTENITQYGKYQQLEGNISTAGAGSRLFRDELKDKIAAGKLDKASADVFFEAYKGTRLQ